MAEEQLEEEKNEGTENKKEKKKKLSKEEKKALKEAKNNMAEEEDEEEESAGGKILIAFVTILILIIWLGIIAILIKCDVGGFGSTVLSPLLKDVPYINMILPASDEIVTEEDTQYKFDSLDDAISRIKELEAQNNTLAAQAVNDAATISSLNSQIVDLSSYKNEQAEFEALKEKFYEEVVFSDNAPDIEQYKTFYESIEPDNAEVLYKQVVEQLEYKEDLDEYIKMYSSMKAKDAAEIFNQMTDDLDLVAAILKQMSSKTSGEILSQMDNETAAKITKIMYPASN